MDAPPLPELSFLPFAQGPVRLAQLAGEVLAWADRCLEAAWAWGAARKHPPTCRKGCAACCRQAVPVSPAEALWLAEHAKNLPVTERRALLARFDGAARALAAAGMTRAPVLSEAAAYFRLGLACPYLEREACSIHAFRPLACREHNMLSPPEHCWEFPHSAQRAFPLAVSFSSILVEMCADLLEGPPEWIPLVRALSWAQEHPDAAARTWDGARLREKLLQKLGRYGLAGG